jgi:membrane fusion protein (multidrug efflux system)
MLLAVIAVAVVLAAALSYWFVIGRFVETTDDAYVGGDVTVMAPKVNGFVTDCWCTTISTCSANQVLIRLDARDYDARLPRPPPKSRAPRPQSPSCRRRSLAAATINEQAAEVRASGAELTRSAEDQTRYRELVKDEAVSNQIVERADADLTKAHAAVDRSGAALLAAQRQICVLGAQIGDAQARVAYGAGGAARRGTERRIHDDPLAGGRLYRQPHRAGRAARQYRRFAADGGAVARTCGSTRTSRKTS